MKQKTRPVPGPRSPRKPAFWRALEERAGDPAFQEHLYNEFPSEIEAISDPVARRTFLKLMGASLALAGVTGCTRQPAETIVPYVRQPEDLIPGRPLFYATAMSLGGVATGLLVESHEGRPTKIEGNPLHPGSLGATDVFAQAAVLGLYDPDRSQTLLNLGDRYRIDEQGIQYANPLLARMGLPVERRIDWHEVVSVRAYRPLRFGARDDAPTALFLNLVTGRRFVIDSVERFEEVHRSITTRLGNIAPSGSGQGLTPS